MQGNYITIKLGIIACIVFGTISGVHATPATQFRGDSENTTNNANEINSGVIVDKEKPSINKDWEKDGGIRVLSIRQSSAGYMLDFRYKVIDPKKAALFINRGNKPLLNVLKNGSILQVPVSSKIGPLRQSAQFAKAGKNYFMLFANPGRMVKPGDKVKVNIGDFKSKTLMVE